MVGIIKGIRPKNISLPKTLRQNSYVMDKQLSDGDYLIEINLAVNSFILNIFRDCIQHFDQEMLSCVRLHGIHAHIVLPPSQPCTSWYQFIQLVKQGHAALVA